MVITIFQDSLMKDPLVIPETDDRHILDIIFGMTSAQALYVAHDLKLFSVLADAPPVASGVGGMTQLDAPACPGPGIHLLRPETAPAGCTGTL